MNTGKAGRIVAAAIFMASLVSCNFSFGNKPGEYESDEPGETVGSSWDVLTPLHSRYTGQFLLGNIISPLDLNTVRFNLLKRHFNTVTAENAMKPDAIQYQRGQFTYPDTMVNAVLEAGMQMHGHTLVWHSQTPLWMNTGVSREQAITNMTNHITQVLTNFQGKVVSWDVVNEAMRNDASPSTDWRLSLRKNENPAQSENSRWNQIIGDEYIELAFKAARDADPAAKLYYNDYNLNMSNPNKAYAVYRMVKDINERCPAYGGRKLIDGIGMQSHHHLNTDPATVEESIQLFASLGVEIAISELDIQAVFYGSPYSSFTEDAAKAQAQKYAALFIIFKKYAANISRVTFWGIDDATSWRKESFPVLFDKQYKAKPAFYAVENPNKY
ncbi:MAG: endo-1,4-beta-xylanase [Treponema sp.]|nr:endo-1,4-beta-xylanase [Treponema sp.]